MTKLLCGLPLIAAAWALPASAQESPNPIQPIAHETAAARPCAGAACSEATTPAPPHHMEVGDATRRLLQRQAQGDGASTLHYAQSGIVAQKVYERYVNSFKHPIPEHSASAVAKTGQGSK